MENPDQNDRYARYLPIVQYVAERSEFSSESVKEACADEAPGFVTRVVNELVREGWLIKDAKNKFRWNPSRGEFSTSKWIDQVVYGTQIKSAPEQGRPRERLLSLGVEILNDADLLAILIRSGRPGESAVDGGLAIANKFAERMYELPQAGRAELKSISSSVDKTAYCQIMAGIELGRRIAAISESQIPIKITGAADAISFCERRFARLILDAKQEEFHLVTLDTKNQVIDTHQVTVGTLDASLVHPREVFRAAIRDAASSVILVHNHPSGDSTPSREDFAVTERLEKAGELIGIDILDHIVLGKGNCTSLREARM